MRCVTVMILEAALLSVLQADFEVVTGGHHTCAMYNQEIRCWGWNNYGTLGIGHSNDVYTPQEVSIDLGSDFTPQELHCGSSHCCVISEARTLKCFGDNRYGQLGYGHTNNIGDHDDEMGDWLPLVDLGTGITVKELGVAFYSACFLSNEDGELRCWGYNGHGELGLGHKNYIGDDDNEMGDNLVTTDLGSFIPEKLIPGSYFRCALSSVENGGEMKCWGANQCGQLGQGDTDYRGDDENEMADNLPVIDFGSDFVVTSASCGWYFCCVMSSTTHDLRCWGENPGGELGIGDTTRRGDNENEMGDNLISVDVGSDFGEIQDFRVHCHATIVQSTNGKFKTWGRGAVGMLGSGDTENVGDDANEMGDYLDLIDVGSGFSASGVQLMTSNSPNSCHACIYEESSDDLLLKCWGRGQYGELGLGDTENRGDDANEMGDYLNFVDLGFISMVTTAPTAPTMAPSVETPSPSVSPSEGPTESCDEADMYPVNWHNMLNSDEQDTALLENYSVDFDASTLSLTFKASVQYVGLSADGNFDDNFNLGTTYWIDFESFSESDGGVDYVGNCGNRRSADYGNLTFEQFWDYPVNPMQLESASNAERMAYPPSDWDLTASTCNVVEFERTFSWTEMTGCVNAADNGLIDITETDDTISLSGTFFVELVSPYSMSSDEYYRTYPLLQQDFGIVLNRQVDALASTGVQLFISSVMAYGRDDEGNYEVTILVQSADYVMLGMGNDSVTSISSPLTVSNIETVTGDCLVASSFTCGQIFTATIPANCSDDDSAVDLSGIYQFGFTPQCQIVDGSEDPACTTFLSTLDNDGKVVLDVDASFIDQCDTDLFSVTFDADLAFYSDVAFSVAVDDGSDPFVIGQDTIYGKVTVDIPVDETGAMYSFVEVEIENVYVCTADDTADLSLDSDSGIGGCLSSDIDADGPYVVYGDGAVTEYLGTTYAATGNEATFSFLTFDTPRTTINVHVQLLLTLTTGERRRMLLQTDIEGEEGNAFRSFIGSASVQEGETTADPVGTDGTGKVSAGFIAALFTLTAYVLG